MSKGEAAAALGGCPPLGNSEKAILALLRPLSATFGPETWQVASETTFDFERLLGLHHKISLFHGPRARSAPKTVKKHIFHENSKNYVLKCGKVHMAEPGCFLAVSMGSVERKESYYAGLLFPKWANVCIPSIGKPQYQNDNFELVDPP